MKEQQASLGRYGHPNVVRYFQTFAPLELLARDEPADVRFQFLAIQFTQRVIKPDTPPKNFFPRHREFRARKIRPSIQNCFTYETQFGSAGKSKGPKNNFNFFAARIPVSVRTITGLAAAVQLRHRAANYFRVASILSDATVS